MAIYKNNLNYIEATKEKLVLDRIKVCFTESIQTQIAAAEALPDAISRAAMMMVQSLLNGNKILCCGNGASAATAQRFAASMIHRFETERPSYPL